MKRMLIFLILLDVLSVLAFSEASDRKTESGKALIFNIPDIQLDIQSYKGGIGFKTGKDLWFLRFMVDFLLNDRNEDSRIVASGLDVLFEWHFNSSKISPYLGADVSIDHSYMRANFTNTDYQKQNILSLAAGPLFGIEIEISKGISLFAEYQLSVSVDWLWKEHSIGGIKSHYDEPMVLSINTELGNNGMLGMCIYF